MKFSASLSIVFVALLVACTQPPADSYRSRIDHRGVEQLWVPSGSFLRGTADIDSIEAPEWVRRIMPSEQPQHKVTLTAGYWIDKHEVSNAAYERFVDDGGYENFAYWSEQGWDWLQASNVDADLPIRCVEPRPDYPRVCINWFEAEAYGNWRRGRLPTEAEWEFAARGPDSLIYPWGNEFDAQRANVIDSSGLSPIDSYPNGRSWIGAYNLSGNAMEWVQDWLDVDYYQLRESADPKGPASGRIKIEKGGWWGSNSAVARAAYHHYEDPPEYQDHHIGFRIVSDN